MGVVPDKLLKYVHVCMCFSSILILPPLHGLINSVTVYSFGDVPCKYHFELKLKLLMGQRTISRTKLMRSFLSLFLFCFFGFLSFQKIFIYLFIYFLRLHLRHMEVPRLGVKQELQLPVYTKATATLDLSCVFNLYHSSRQCQILSPLSRARD